jgi:two-component system sensor histidine kinase UhpB
MPLFWRVFLANAAILLAGILVLAFTPLRVSEHATLPEIIDLLGGLALIIVVNWLILRPLFRPLERLAGRMDEADVLRGGQRVPTESSGEVGALERSFNTMMERLETERREAGARALATQEEERQRIARGLHDEVGQTMTGVLLVLKRLVKGATPEQGEPRRRPPNRAGVAARDPRPSRPPQRAHKPRAHVLGPDRHPGATATRHPTPHARSER